MASDVKTAEAVPLQGIGLEFSPEEVQLLKDVLDLDAICRVLEPADHDVLESIKSKLALTPTGG